MPACDEYTTWPMTNRMMRWFYTFCKEAFLKYHNNNGPCGRLNTLKTQRPRLDPRCSSFLCILPEIYGSRTANIIKLWFAVFCSEESLRRHSRHANAIRRFFFLFFFLLWREKSVRRSERYLSRPQAHESCLAAVILCLMCLISCFTAFRLLANIKFLIILGGFFLH